MTRWKSVKQNNYAEAMYVQLTFSYVDKNIVDENVFPKEEAKQMWYILTNKKINRIYNWKKKTDLSFLLLFIYYINILDTSQF